MTFVWPPGLKTWQSEKNSGPRCWQIFWSDIKNGSFLSQIFPKPWFEQCKLSHSNEANRIKKKDLSQECPPKKCGKKHMIDVVLGKKSWISSRKKIAFVLFLAPKNIGILPLRSFLKASEKCEKSPFSVFITRWSCVRTREDWTSSILVRTRSTWSTWCRWI